MGSWDRRSFSKYRFLKIDWPISLSEYRFPNIDFPLANNDFRKSISEDRFVNIDFRIFGDRLFVNYKLNDFVAYGAPYRTLVTRKPKGRFAAAASSFFFFFLQKEQARQPSSRQLRHRYL